MKTLCYLIKQINNKGITLVELVCAMAIMSVVGAAVAGIMIVSANTYSRGASDIQLQETAQLLSNQVNNLVQSGYEAETAGDSHLIIKKAVPGGSAKQYDIWLDVDPASSIKKVYYTESQLLADGSIDSTSNPEPMAEHIEKFVCDANDFANSGIVRMYIKVKKDSHSFAGNYTAMSRNLKANTEVREGELTMTYTPEYMLEPNQTYPLYAVMSDGTGVEWEIAESAKDAGTVISEDETGKKVITIGNGEKLEKLTLVISSETRRENDGVTPKIQKTATVYIRRINNIEITYTNTRTGEQSKRDTSAGASYNVVFNPIGTNLTKIPDVPDMGYDPYEEGGVIKQGLYSSISPRDIILEIEVFKNNQKYTENLGNFLNDLHVVSNMSLGTPYVSFKLRDKLENGEYVKITARSTHALGTVEVVEPDGSTTTKKTNITGSQYDNVVGSWILYDTPFPTAGGRITRGGGDDIVYTIQQLLDIIRAECHNDRIQSTDIQKTYRFCELELDDEGKVVRQGMWTNWRGFFFGDLSLKVPIEASLSLDCDKSYYFEIAFAAFDPSDADHHTQIWPTVENERDQYVYTEFIPTLTLMYSSSYFSNQSGCNVYEDVIDEPFTLYINENATVGYALTGTYKEILTQNSDRFIWTVERWDPEIGDWSSDIEYEDITFNSNKSNVSDIRVNRKGTYRLMLNLKDMPSYRYVPDASGYVSITKDYVQYANENTGKGIFTFTVNKNSKYWNSKYIEYRGNIYSTDDCFLCEDELISIKDGTVQKVDFYDSNRHWSIPQAKAYRSNDTLYYADDAVEYVKYKYSFTYASNSNTVTAVTLIRGGKTFELSKSNYERLLNNTSLSAVIKVIANWW